jgi:hypothetical protein
MRLITKSSGDRVVDELLGCLKADSSLDFASSAFSLYAFAELKEALDKLKRCRLVLPSSEKSDLELRGSNVDRPFRNRLQGQRLAAECMKWPADKLDIREANDTLPQSVFVTVHPNSNLHRRSPMSEMTAINIVWIEIAKFEINDVETNRRKCARSVLARISGTRRAVTYSLWINAGSFWQNDE